MRNLDKIIDILLKSNQPQSQTATKELNAEIFER